MRGVYTLSVDTQTGILDDRTILYAYGPSNMCVEILSARITQLNVDTAEQLGAGVYKISTITGATSDDSGNIRKHEDGDPLCSVICSGTVSAVGTQVVETGTPIDAQGFNNLAGYYYDPIPEERVVLSPGQGVALKLSIAPASNATRFIGEMNIREIGG